MLNFKLTRFDSGSLGDTRGPRFVVTFPGHTVPPDRSVTDALDIEVDVVAAVDAQSGVVAHVDQRLVFPELAIHLLTFHDDQSGFLRSLGLFHRTPDLTLGQTLGREVELGVGHAHQGDPSVVRIVVEDVFRDLHFLVKAEKVDRGAHGDQAFVAVFVGNVAVSEVEGEDDVQIGVRTSGNS